MPLIASNLNEDMFIKPDLHSQREQSPPMRMLDADDSDYSWTSDDQIDKGLKTNIFK